MRINVKNYTMVYIILFPYSGKIVISYGARENFLCLCSRSQGAMTCSTIPRTLSHSFEPLYVYICTSIFLCRRASQYNQTTRTLVLGCVTWWYCQLRHSMKIRDTISRPPETNFSWSHSRKRYLKRGDFTILICSY